MAHFASDSHLGRGCWSSAIHSTRPTGRHAGRSDEFERPRRIPSSSTDHFERHYDGDRKLHALPSK